MDHTLLEQNRGRCTPAQHSGKPSEGCSYQNMAQGTYDHGLDSVTLATGIVFLTQETMGTEVPIWDAASQLPLSKGRTHLSPPCSS